MMTPSETGPRYRVESVVRAFRVLDALDGEDDTRCLQDLSRIVGLPVSTTLRLLRTLESCGVVERVGPQGYRRLLQRPKSQTRRIGFAVTTARKGFRKEVADGLAQAAAERGVELLTLDTPADRRTALRNADAMVRARVDLVIDFQTNGELGHEVAAKYFEANIPMIAVDLPHPGATFFGVNNFLAGRDGGRWLGGWLRRNWGGRVDLVVLGAQSSGGVVASRCKGALMGLQDRLGTSCVYQTVEMDAASSFDVGFRNVQRVLARSSARRVVFVHPTDPGVLGGLTALNEAGSRCEAVMLGFGGNLETRMALRDPGSQLAACVGFMPERYGPTLLLTALRILDGKAVPPSIFVEHEVLTPENVDLWYPNELVAAESNLFSVR